MKTKELFKEVELYIQNDPSYKECIGTGHVAERFDKLLINLKQSSPAMSPKPQEEITDEMISEAASLNSESTWKGHSQGWYYHFVEGAEFVRSQMTANRREELIDFLVWYSEKMYNSVTDGTADEVVDNYLQ